MTTMTNAERAAELRTEAAAHRQAARESFDRCDTDGFLSQWASDLTASKLQAEADLLERGGASSFKGLFRVSDGRRVRAKLIDGKYGRCWAVCDQNGRYTGQFIGQGNVEWDEDGHLRFVPSKKMKTLGLYEAWEDAPARIEIVGGGRGLAGAANCRPASVRTDAGYPTDAVDL